FRPLRPLPTLTRQAPNPEDPTASERHKPSGHRLPRLPESHCGTAPRTAVPGFAPTPPAAAHPGPRPARTISDSALPPHPPAGLWPGEVVHGACRYPTRHPAPRSPTAPTPLSTPPDFHSRKALLPTLSDNRPISIRPPMFRFP